MLIVLDGNAEHVPEIGLSEKNYAIVTALDLCLIQIK